MKDLLYKLAAVRDQIDVEQASLILEKTLEHIKDKYTYNKVKNLLNKADMARSDKLKRKYIKQAIKALYYSYKKQGLGLFDTAYMRESEVRQLLLWIALLAGMLAFPAIPIAMLGVGYGRKKYWERRLRKLMEK